MKIRQITFLSLICLQTAFCEEIKIRSAAEATKIETGERVLAKVAEGFLISSKGFSGKDYLQNPCCEHFDPGIINRIKKVELLRTRGVVLLAEAKAMKRNLAGIETIGIFEEDYVFQFPNRKGVKWEFLEVVVSESKNNGVVNVRLFLPGDEEQKIWIDREVYAKLFFYRELKTQKWLLSEIYFEDLENSMDFWTLSGRLASFFNPKITNIFEGWEKELQNEKLR